MVTPAYGRVYHNASKGCDEMKVLIIDDSPLVRTILKEYLREAGHEIREAGTNQEALWLFSTEHPDLIIRDLFMPDGDAIESIHYFKAMDPGVKILICSTESSKNEILSGLKAGALDVVLKPLEKDQVIFVLNRMAAS
ncbi:two-component system chemotaxis response regulator CheY [Hydrogenispora ethanolica]|uniref:Two-component system chemotaxis response regulator CheY n=2 Tax=Hydrogenispora ethanolica TaxID=1082276 RepID=A0A4R1RSB7_HYDET|nr:two-component system chemotaxis response regulator CheY [Hydrogenispora ethanolica]